MNFLVIPICVGLVGSVQVVRHENTTYFLEGYKVKCKPAPRESSETVLPEPTTSTNLPGIDQDPPELDFGKAEATRLELNSGERDCRLKVGETVLHYNTVAKCSEGNVTRYNEVKSLTGKQGWFLDKPSATVSSDDGRIVLREPDEKSEYLQKYQIFIPNSEELQESDRILVEDVKRCFDKDNVVTIAPTCP